MRMWGTSGARRSCGADRVVRPCGRGMRIPTPVFALARNDSASRCRDVEDAVPYEIAGGVCGQETRCRAGPMCPAA